MSRKKTKTPEPVTVPQVSEADTGTATLEGAAAPSTDEPAASEGQPPRNWGPPYKSVFSSAQKGIEMGENRRFKQRVLTFREKPDEAIIAVLKANGFTYRPSEKAWTIPATAESRLLSERLAHEFAGESQASER